MTIHISNLTSWLWDLLNRLPICHHLAARSRVFGIDLPLCCRCSGIYSFIVVGMVVNYFLKFIDIHQNKRLVAFVALSLVTGVEACVEQLFGVDPGNVIRLTTGAVSGFAIGVLLSAGISGIKTAPAKKSSR